MVFHGVPQRLLSVYRISIAATLTCPGEVARFTELGDDTLDRPLSDSHADSYVPRPSCGIFIDADQYVGVVRQEGPLRSAPIVVLGCFSHGSTGLP